MEDEEHDRRKMKRWRGEEGRTLVCGNRAKAINILQLVENEEFSFVFKEDTLLLQWSNQVLAAWSYSRQLDFSRPPLDFYGRKVT